MKADELGLFWSMLPKQPLASAEERSAPGKKKNQNWRITLMCANVTGNHKLRLLVEGTAHKSRVVKSIKIPLCYRDQKNAWMTRD